MVNKAGGYISKITFNNGKDVDINKNDIIIFVGVYYDENVPLFRKNGYRKSGTMILRVRSRDTALN